MKKSTIYLFILTMVFVRLNAQSAARFYILNGPVVLEECDMTGTGNNTLKLVPSNLKFTIITSVGDYYVLLFGNLKNEVTNSLNYTRSLGLANPTRNQRKVRRLYQLSEDILVNHASGNRRFFLMRKTMLDSVASIIIKRFLPAYGSAILPFKFRSQTGDFKKDLAISGLGGMKISSTRGYFSFALVSGIGVSSVSVDSLNTFGVVKKTEERAAITIPLGVVIEWRKLQIGIFTGWDWLAKSSTDNWRYQGKHWLAMGIGFSIFSEEKPAKQAETN